jgi:Domain of unknown function (DUF4326)
MLSGRLCATRAAAALSVPDQRSLEEKPMPKVVNLKGTGRRPNEVGPNEVYIGRHTQNGWRKSKWGNPFRLPRNTSMEQRAEVLAMYRRWLLGQSALMGALPELHGKNLLCWCAPEACHGDVLLALANAERACRTR